MSGVAGEHIDLILTIHTNSAAGSEGIRNTTALNSKCCSFCNLKLIDVATSIIVDGIIHLVRINTTRQLRTRLSTEEDRSCCLGSKTLIKNVCRLQSKLVSCRISNSNFVLKRSRVHIKDVLIHLNLDTRVQCLRNVNCVTCSSVILRCCQQEGIQVFCREGLIGRNWCRVASRSDDIVDRIGFQTLGQSHQFIRNVRVGSEGYQTDWGTCVKTV